MRIIVTLTTLVSTAALFSQPVQARDNFFEGFNLEWEAGPAWISRNDIQIPSDTGTRFDMTELHGEGPALAMRFYATYEFDDRHALRLNLAPYETSGNGRFDMPVQFAGETFDSERNVYGQYRFNTYRLTYRYMFHRSANWDLGAGAALLVRDAKIELQQGDTRGIDDDLGVVPLAHFYSAYRFNDRQSVVFDIEALGASQGRAIDASLKYYHRLENDWKLGLGYRTLEGGADNNDLYTFAWLHFVVASVGFEF